MRNEHRATKATWAVTATAFLWPRTPLMAPRRWIRLVASRASFTAAHCAPLPSRYRPGPFQPSTSCPAPRGREASWSSGSWDRSRCGTKAARYPWADASRVRFSPCSSSTPTRPFPADALIDERSGEDSPERAAAAVRVKVLRLRKALPQDVLTPAFSCSWTRSRTCPPARSSRPRDRGWLGPSLPRRGLETLHEACVRVAPRACLSDHDRLASGVARNQSRIEAMVKVAS
jgi:hypothetical protein